MSNNTQTMTAQPAPWQIAIADAEAKFTEIAVAEGNFLNYQKEALFAMQSVMKSSYLMEAANQNPQSLLNAVINVASIGLSLNPAEKLAYLVPRDKNACLDISYIGLIKLATDTGNIVWAKAELVYENDQFEMTGINSLPFHKYNPFSTGRGNIIGGYSVAKLAGDDYIVDVQTEAYFAKVCSVAKTKNIWTAWPEAMRLKTLIKVGSKFWPKSKKLDTAIHYLNDSEGLDLPGDAPTKAPVSMPQAVVTPQPVQPNNQAGSQPPAQQQPDQPKVVQGQVVAQSQPPAANNNPVNQSMLKVIKAQLVGGQKTEADIVKQFDVASLDQLPAAKINDILKFIRG